MQLTYQKLLKREFDQRVNRNGAYSLRAYAKSLGLTAPHLSAVLSLKKGLSLKSADKICKSIKWNNDEVLLFKTLVTAQHARKKVVRRAAVAQVRELSRQKDFRAMHLEHFNLISDWQHFAILHLFELEEFSSELSWIARKLSLDERTVLECLKRLERLDLIDRRGPIWKIKSKFNSTPNVPSSAIRSNHHQVLKLAGVALEAQAIGNRDFSSMFMAIDKNDLPEAKLQLAKFRRRFCQNFDAKKKNALYCLSMQFFEMTQSENTQETLP